jgi:hypothetical protein
LILYSAGHEQTGQSCQRKRSQDPGVTWGCTRLRARHYSTHLDKAAQWHKVAQNSVTATSQNSNTAASLELAALANGCRTASKESACAESSRSIADSPHNSIAGSEGEGKLGACAITTAREDQDPAKKPFDLPTCSVQRSLPADKLRIGSEPKCTFPDNQRGPHPLIEESRKRLTRADHLSILAAALPPIPLERQVRERQVAIQ